MKNIAILGSGMAGFGAAHRLHSSGVSSSLYEMKPHWGGHTASHQFAGGWTFDEGPHISFSKEQRVQDLLASNIDGKYEKISAYVNNYWKGHWIKHPAPVNLHGLPPDLVTRILIDFFKAQQNQPKEVANYEEWLRASYGDTFAETFPMEYTVKYHTTTASNMNTDWIGPRLYKANLEEVIRGALVPSTRDVHYITDFRYPTHGGFAAYLEKFTHQTRIHLAHEACRIEPTKGVLHFKNGVTAPYDALISSVPLPEFVPMIDGAPNDVVEAAAKLACSQVVVVCLGVDRPDLINAHWTYFYDRDIFFTRLSTPHMQSPHNVPPGCGALQAECYYSAKYRPLDRKPDDCIDPVINDLRRVGVLRESDRILFRHAMYIPYANVIFDLDCNPSLKLVHGYLDDIGIAYCGRYGAWEYIWTDQSFISGENAAQAVLDGTRGRRRGG